MNKLAIIIVNRDIERSLATELMENKFVFTRIGSTGGFLKKKNATLLLGISEERVDELVALVKQVAKSSDTLIASDAAAPLSSEVGVPEVPLGAATLHVGGATLFIASIERSESV